MESGFLDRSSRDRSRPNSADSFSSALASSTAISGGGTSTNARDDSAATTANIEASTNSSSHSAAEATPLTLDSGGESRRAASNAFPDPPEEVPAAPSPSSSAAPPPPAAATPAAGDSRSHFRTFMDSVLQGLRNATAAVPIAADRPEQPAATADDAPPATSANEQEAAPAGTTGSNPSASPPLYFRLPFLSSTTSRPAVVRFQPSPLPPVQFPFGANNLTPGVPGTEEAHIPVQPIFIPIGTSPLPFSFLYDTITNTAWPVAQVQVQQEATTPGQAQQPPGAFPAAGSSAEQRGGMIDTAASEIGGEGGGEHDPHRPVSFQYVTGAPFRISLTFTAPGDAGPGGLFFGGGDGPAPPGSVPDPAKAKTFVEELERADAELRVRMARLGMGDIGAYGLGSGRGALGCGICLDKYEGEDRPEWIAGASAKEAEVVAVPCAGHHTLHAGCLREWLAEKAPKEWSCPFCRSPLSEKDVHQVLSGEQKIKAGGKGRSLREEVRFRERAHGWRCDAPACLPRYPPSDLPSGEGATISGDGEEAPEPEGPGDFLTTRTIELSPCKHKIHIDCLCTALRLDGDLKTPSIEQPPDMSDGDDADSVMTDADDRSDDTHRAAGDGDGQASDEEEDDDDAYEVGLSATGEQAQDPVTGEGKTIGKWVSCPSCRRESWAAIPAHRKRKLRRRVSRKSRQTGDEPEHVQSMTE